MPAVSKFQQSRPLRSSALAQSALSVLHDHDKLMKSQPLVGQIEALPSPPDRAQLDEQTAEYHWFRQTEYVPFLPFGIWKTKVVFENYYKDLPDIPIPSSATTPTPEGQMSPVEGGVECKVYAPCLEIKAVFRVTKKKPDPRKDTLRQRDLYKKADELESGWKITEETEMSCRNLITKWLSVSQHRKAQKQMMDRIVFEAEKRTYRTPATEG